MILKWLVTGFVAFSIYRFFIKPKTVSAPPPRQQMQQQASPNSNTEGEFIEYEEVE